MSDVVIGCATLPEFCAAPFIRKRTHLIGMRAGRYSPRAHGHRVISFGVAGALASGVRIATIIDADRIINEEGGTLWEGHPLGIRGACVATLLSTDRIIDDPDERRALYDRTGAMFIDMESHVLAKRRVLHGCIRAVSDTPELPLGGLTRLVNADSRLNLAELPRLFTEPMKTVRAISSPLAALWALARVELPELAI